MRELGMRQGDRMLIVNPFFMHLGSTEPLILVSFMGDDAPSPCI